MIEAGLSPLFGAVILHTDLHAYKCGITVSMNCTAFISF